MDAIHCHPWEAWLGMQTLFTLCCFQDLTCFGVFGSSSLWSLLYAALVPQKHDQRLINNITKMYFQRENLTSWAPCSFDNKYGIPFCRKSCCWSSHYCYNVHSESLLSFHSSHSLWKEHNINTMTENMQVCMECLVTYLFFFYSEQNLQDVCPTTTTTNPAAIPCAGNDACAGAGHSSRSKPSGCDDANSANHTIPAYSYSVSTNSAGEVQLPCTKFLFHELCDMYYKLTLTNTHSTLKVCYSASYHRFTHLSSGGIRMHWASSR